MKKSSSSKTPGLVTFGLIFCLYSHQAWSEEPKVFYHYVTDKITTSITLREGPSTEYRVIKKLPSGTAVEMLSADEKGWSKVKVDNRTTGWVITRFLQTDEIAEVKLANALADNTSLKQELAAVKKEIALLKATADSNEKSLKKLRTDNFQLQKDLDYYKALSTQESKLIAENEQLKADLQQTATNLQLTQRDLEVATSDNKVNWFLLGAAVLLLGLLLGRFFRPPSLRKSRWNEL